VNISALGLFRLLLFHPSNRYLTSPSLLPGEHIVKQLLKNNHWTSITTIGRRPLDITSDKLHQHTIDMDTLPTQHHLFSGADSVFVALGTTRAVSGSADAFRKVDRDYVRDAATAARQANVPHYSLVSAQGANASLPATDWKIMHGLLYSKTKGEAEQAVISAGFPAVTIMRPGLIERGEKARAAEKIYSKIVGSVPASQIASVMIKEAERVHEKVKMEGGGEEAGGEVEIFSMAEIKMGEKKR